MKDSREVSCSGDSFVAMDCRASLAAARGEESGYRATRLALFSAHLFDPFE